MDRNIEFQQVVSRQPFGVVVLVTKSNRLVDLQPLVPDLIQVLREVRPGELRKLAS